MPVEHGVDLETFEAFAKHAAENPEDVQMGLSAEAIYENICAHSLAKMDSYEVGGDEIDRPTREYTIPFGAWKEVQQEAGWESHSDRMEPIEVSLAALAACLNVGISINALANGVDIDDLETSVRTDFDPGVLFGLKDLDEADSVYDDIKADIEVAGADVDEDQIAEWAQRAPVYTLVALAQNIDISVNATTEVPADD